MKELYLVFVVTCVSSGKKTNLLLIVFLDCMKSTQDLSLHLLKSIKYLEIYMYSFLNMNFKLEIFAKL